MASSPDQLAAAAARDFAQRLAAAWQARLGPELLGAYLIGSLAHGGFSRRYSDIDMAIVAENELAATAFKELSAMAPQTSAELAPKLSIFFTDRSFASGRFPSLDRVDYLDHAVVLVESTRIVPPRPTLEEIREYLGGVPLANWISGATAFAKARELHPRDRKAYLRALLYPARFVFSWMTGRMGSNDEAVAYLADHAPIGLDVDLIRSALACRRDAADPDPLFAARAGLLRQIAACARLMEESAVEGPP
jgi:predicted nucleotidyltransferase